MTQTEIIAAVKGIHAEVDHEGVDIVYNDNNYDYDIRFTSWDCLFTIEVYSKDSESPLAILPKTMTEIFDYTVDLHSEYMRDIDSMIDTRDYLDVYSN
mgnify:FL=1